MHYLARSLTGLGLAMFLSASIGCGVSPNSDDDTNLPGDDDASIAGDDDATGAGDDDATSSGDDDATGAGDDDATSSGDDDATWAGDDDATSSGDDDATWAGDDDATGSGDDDTPSYELTECSEKTRVFWAWDLSKMPPRSVEVPATCRYTGPASYVYVADDQWDVTVTDELAREFATTFEYRSSAGALDRNIGLYGNDRLVFGDIPDKLDHDPRMYILLMNLKDYVNSDGEVFSFDGFFNAYDEQPDSLVQKQTLGLYHSNECEMLYLNSRIRSVVDPYTLAVAAHELQHLIAYNYDTSEEVWMSEALAEVAMLVNGYFTDVGWVESYASDPATPLVTNTASGSYGAYLLWGMYLYEQNGLPFMMALEEEQADGATGLNRALKGYGESTDFETLFGRWVVANALQDTRVGKGEYGYDFSDDLPPMATVAEFSGTGGGYDGEVAPFGVDYLEISSINANSTLTVTSETTSSLLVQLIEWDLKTGTAQVSAVRESQGAFTSKLDGGVNLRYVVVVTSMDLSQVDKGTTVGYTVKVGK